MHVSQTQPTGNDECTILGLLRSLVLAILLPLAITTFVAAPYTIASDSMAPTLIAGDLVLVFKGGYLGHGDWYRTGDVVAFHSPRHGKHLLVKRIAGIPGQTILPATRVDSLPRGKSDRGSEVRIPSGCYFVLGDNGVVSRDSRHWGYVREDDIVGRVVLILWSSERRSTLSYRIRWNRLLLRLNRPTSSDGVGNASPCCVRSQGTFSPTSYTAGLTRLRSASMALLQKTELETTGTVSASETAVMPTQNSVDSLLTVPIADPAGRRYPGEDEL